MNNARPISPSRSDGILGIVLPPSMGRADAGRVDRYPVKALRIVAEDLPLEAARYVAAIGQRRDGVGELTVPMRVVRREKDVVGREELRHVAQGLLFRLAGHEHAATGHIFRGF